VGIIHGFFNKWVRVFFGMFVGVIFRKRIFLTSLDEEIALAEAAHQPAVVSAAVQE
jgi:hypothetical protein